MSRLRRIEQSHRYFFVTTNLTEHTPPFLPAECDMLVRNLGDVRSSRDFLLLAYVVMPDHVHLLIYPRETTLTLVLQDFKKRAACTIHKSRRSLGPVWQSRFFDFICRRVRDYWSKLEYIHQNPVTAGLVDKPEDWRWSSAFPGALRPDHVEMPLGADTLLWPAHFR